MADVSRMIGENIATLANVATSTDCPYMVSKWMDESETKANTEDFNGDAIAADIIKRAGLTFTGQEGQDGSI